MSTPDLLIVEEAAPDEGAEARQRRVVREAGELARARASAAAGRLVESAKVKTWLDSIGTDHELPVPYVRS